MRTAQVLIVVSSLLGGSLVVAQPEPAVSRLLEEYRQLGVENFSTARAKAFWQAEHPGPDGRTRRCASCHTPDPRRPGRHVVTGKVIAPMAPSVNDKRLQKIRKIRKWFRRNCKWTLGRECTAQEMGDVLTWLSQQ